MRLAGLAAAALALAAAPAFAQVAVTPLAPGETLLEVVAEGETRVRPDRVGLSGGVTTTGVTAREALDSNARAMSAVVQALRAAGVRENEIQTRQISVQPRFEQNREYVEQPRIIGYVAQNTVAVATTRISLVPRLIEAMFTAGANNVYGPTFTLEDDRAALAEARSDAVARARAEADAYAAAFGKRVLRVVRVSERGSNVQPLDIVVTGSRVRQFGAPPPPPPPPPSVPIEEGQLQQRVTLFVDFALADR